MSVPAASGNAAACLSTKSVIDGDAMRRYIVLTLHDHDTKGVAKSRVVREISYTKSNVLYHHFVQVCILWEVLYAFVDAFIGEVACVALAALPVER